jgi:1-deoxy-D-xylulose-5-phosphate reductoisomerase
VTILGATGSIGRNTIDLIERDREKFVVEALTANGSAEQLAATAKKLGARYAVVADESKYLELKHALSGSDVQAGAGQEALVEAAERPAEWVMAGIVGAAGLRPTMAAVRRGAIVAFANKECLVCAGDLMMHEVAANGARMIPVDSEHNAIFQVFDFDHPDKVERIILTASGGPFRTMERRLMAAVTPRQAVAHPNWDMGAKISVDSATMMNKGLELIEAHHLFALPESRIEILVHPQSIVHSMVAYIDGSVLAQLGTPDMRTPISFALGWPERMAAPSARLDLAAIGSLTFERPDPIRFPALTLARSALKSGGAAPTVLNAANEVAVHAFLAGRIGFLDIAGVVEKAVERLGIERIGSIEDVLAVDVAARKLSAELMSRAHARA